MTGARALMPAATLALALACGCMRAGFEQADAAYQPIIGGDGDAGDGGAVDGGAGDGGAPGRWIEVKGGTFTMGSAKSTPCRFPNEDRHQVTLTRGYAIQRTEVTQGQFLAVMGYNPSHFTACGADCPVEVVTWHQAAAYCNALSARAGLQACYTCQGSGNQVSCVEAAAAGSTIYACEGYRLPTEAEWEHAYRAGTTTTYYSGDNDPTTCKSCAVKDANADAIGWYCANSGGKTHPVEQKQPNKWGLFDMGGNVWEWCHDGYKDHLGTAAVTDPVSPASDLHLARGGAWINHAGGMHAAQRYSLAPSYNSNGVGFRCVRTRK